MKKISKVDNRMDNMLSESIKNESVDTNIKQEVIVATNTYHRFLYELYKKNILDRTQFSKLHNEFRKTVSNLNNTLGI